MNSDGLKRLADFWLVNIPPINLWSIQQLLRIPLGSPYQLTEKPSERREQE